MDTLQVFDSAKTLTMASARRAIGISITYDDFQPPPGIIDATPYFSYTSDLDWTNLSEWYILYGDLQRRLYPLITETVLFGKLLKPGSDFSGHSQGWARLFLLSICNWSYHWAEVRSSAVFRNVRMTDS